jgi:squalene synthase HpnC
MGRAGSENFPVASHLLPRRVRTHLLALYGYARLVDDMGDESGGDRLAGLDWLAAEVDNAFAGNASHPLMQRLGATVRQCALPREPLLRLIEANRLDQHVSRYRTWEQLMEYCALSANPVGELVLAVLGQATPARIALSDAICTGLQLAEHWQDVAEDRDRGRIYLPAEDLERFGCTEEDLAGTRAGTNLRDLMAHEVARTRALFDRGSPLVGQLRGRSRLAVAAFVGGGRAALDAIERAGFDVLAGAHKAARRRRALASMKALRGGRG